MMEFGMVLILIGSLGLLTGTSPNVSAVILSAGVVITFSGVLSWI